jgi:hypothetical protein
MNQYNPKFTQLYYRSADWRTGTPLLCDKPRDGEYYKVLEYPLAEMTSETARGIANDFVTMSCAPAWRMCGRRTIESGDIFTHAPYTYMFILPDDLQLYTRNAQRNAQALNWPHLQIVRLEINCEHMMKLCTI